MRILGYFFLIAFLASCASSGGDEGRTSALQNEDRWVKAWNERPVVFSDDIENENQREILARQNEKIKNLEQDIAKLREEQKRLLAVVKDNNKVENFEELSAGEQNLAKQHMREKIGIHVASYQNESTTRQLAKRFESLLGNTIYGKQPYFEKIRVSQQEYFRLIFGPYTNIDEAEETCRKIKNDVGFCAPVAYSGVAIMH